MSVRTDYVNKHSGVCLSCQRTGNKQAYKHGGVGTRLYRIWQNMLNRCRNSNIPNYKYWGNKGVLVCEEWHSFEKFREWAIANGYTDELTIDRIDCNGNYEPNNCQWITLQENARKDKVTFKTFEEKVRVYEKRKELKLTQVEMAALIGVPRSVLQRAEREVKRYADAD